MDPGRGSIIRRTAKSGQELSSQRSLLEGELQAELHDSGWIRGVHLGIADIVRSVAGRAGRGLVTAKQVYAAPLRVVKRIESFQPELQVATFVVSPWQFEIPHQRQVPVVTAGSGEWVLAQVSEHAWLIVGAQLVDGYLPDSAGIEPRGNRPELGIVHNALFYLERPDAVAHHWAADARSQTCDTASKIKRRSGEETGDAAYLPTGEQMAGKEV
jgi:hypothetical protein